YGLYLWDMLWAVGASFGIAAAGGAVFESLRLEKRYRFWRQDIHADYTPLKAGLGFAVRFAKGTFLGQDAVLRQKDAGIARKLCALTLDDHEPVVLSKAPILDGDRVLGYVTSAAYGYLSISHAGEGTA